MGQQGNRRGEDYQIAEKNGNPGRAVPTVERNDGRNGGPRTRSKRRTTPTVPAGERQRDDPGSRRTARHGPTPNEQRHRQTPTGDTQRSTTNTSRHGPPLETRPGREGTRRPTPATEHRSTQTAEAATNRRSRTSTTISNRHRQPTSDERQGQTSRHSATTTMRRVVVERGGGQRSRGRHRRWGTDCTRRRWRLIEPIGPPGDRQATASSWGMDWAGTADGGLAESRPQVDGRLERGGRPGTD